MFMYVFIYYLPLHAVNFKWNLTDLNSNFSFFKTGCHTRVNLTRQSYSLPIAGEIIVGFIPKGINVIWNAALSRIWTRFVMSITNDDNHYTMSISMFYVCSVLGCACVCTYVRMCLCFSVCACVHMYVYALNVWQITWIANIVTDW